LENGTGFERDFLLMKLIGPGFSWNDYLYLQKACEKSMKRINDLLESCTQNPLEKIGKPKAQKGDLQEY
jgi:Txe/YoeB family toxin of Txe-Axe toxin-antitoxin module